MKNVEFKAELRDPAIAREVLRGLGATHIGTFAQTDTYYKVAAGRLKKRETQGQEIEYIFYERPNEIGSKVSSFTIYPEARARERFGREELPIWIIVNKTRSLYMLENTRIHLDHVDGLGEFLEFEYLVSRKFTLEQGEETVRTLRKQFAFVLGEAIDCGYSDLLAASTGGRPD